MGARASPLPGLFWWIVDVGVPVGSSFRVRRRATYKGPDSFRRLERCPHIGAAAKFPF